MEADHRSNIFILSITKFKAHFEGYTFANTCVHCGSDQAVYFKKNIEQTERSMRG